MIDLNEIREMYKDDREDYDIASNARRTVPKLVAEIERLSKALEEIAYYKATHGSFLGVEELARKALEE